jgi:hypothetical protein
VFDLVTSRWHFSMTTSNGFQGCPQQLAADTVTLTVSGDNQVMDEAASCIVLHVRSLEGLDLI